MRHGYVFEVPADGTAPATAHGHGPLLPRGGRGRPATGLRVPDRGRDAVRALPLRAGRARPPRRRRPAADARDRRRRRADLQPTPAARDYGQVSWVDIDDPDPAPGATAPSTQGIAQGRRQLRAGRGHLVRQRRALLRLDQRRARRPGPGVRARPGHRPAARLFFLSPSLDVLDSPDNVCVSPRGGLVLCEDGSGQEFMHGLTPDGDDLQVRREPGNGGASGPARPSSRRTATGCSSTSQSPGITFAITGPWRQGTL